MQSKLDTLQLQFDNIQTSYANAQKKHDEDIASVRKEKKSLPVHPSQQPSICECCNNGSFSPVAGPEREANW